MKTKQKRLSSYQKLKKKYEEEKTELIEDITNLIKHSDSITGTGVRVKWLLRLNLAEAIMFGDGGAWSGLDDDNKTELSGIWGRSV